MAEVKFSPNVGTRQGNEKRLPEGRGKGRKKPESQKARTDRKEGDDTHGPDHAEGTSEVKGKTAAFGLPALKISMK